MHINCRDLTEIRNDQLDSLKSWMFCSRQHIMTQFPGITTSVKSLMKITKNKGPNKEPRGTPNGIAHHVEFIPSMTTLCSLSVK